MSRPSLTYPLTALGSLLGLLGLVLAPGAPLASLDTALSERARAFGLAHPAWVEVMRWVTHLGTMEVLLAAGAVLAVVLLLRREYAPAAATGLVAVIVPGLWALAHLLLHRPRPVDGFVSVASNGFPSGHASHGAAVGLLAVVLLWPRLRWPGRVATVVAAVAFAGAIGLSRIALLAHWPSDVLGGWLLGCVVVLLCGRIGPHVRIRDMKAKPPAGVIDELPLSRLRR